MKRLSSLFLGVIIALNTLFVVNAQEMTDKKEYGWNEYIEAIIPYYLQCKPGDYSSVEISQPFTIADNFDDNMRVYYLLDNDVFFGYMFVTVINGEYHSSFIFDDDSIINSQLHGDSPIRMVVDSNDTIYVETKNGFLSSSERNCSDDYKAPQFRTLNLHSIENSRSSVNLPVSFVANDTVQVYEGGQLVTHGLCWAACVAAVLNYYDNSGYTAMNIFTNLNYNYSGTPVGNTTWITRGYAINNRTCTNYYSSMYFEDIQDVITYLSKPIIFDIFRTINNEKKGHTVVCHYFQEGSSNVVLGFMDPNINSTVYIYTPENVFPDSFVYTTPAHNGVNAVTYPSWERSHY